MEERMWSSLDADGELQYLADLTQVLFARELRNAMTVDGRLNVGETKLA